MCERRWLLLVFACIEHAGQGFRSRREPTGKDDEAKNRAGIWNNCTFYAKQQKMQNVYILHRSSSKYLACSTTAFDGLLRLNQILILFAIRLLLSVLSILLIVIPRVLVPSLALTTSLVEFVQDLLRDTI